MTHPSVRVHSILSIHTHTQTNHRYRLLIVQYFYFYAFQKLVVDLAVVKSRRHTALSCARLCAVAKPIFSGCRSVSTVLIPRLHDEAGSTSWLNVSWTSQHDVCSTFARRLLDVCSMFAMLYACFIFARCLLDACSTLARSCKRSMKHSLHETIIK